MAKKANKVIQSNNDPAVSRLILYIRIEIAKWSTGSLVPKGFLRPCICCALCFFSILNLHNVNTKAVASAVVRWIVVDDFFMLPTQKSRKEASVSPARTR